MRHELSNTDWNFPPTGGGIEVIQETALTNFRESPIDKFVREVLQNSTDAHDTAMGPVEVTFQEENYPSELFGAESLLQHIEACIQAAAEEGQAQLVERYQNAATAVAQPIIRCLNVCDRNTTGLSGYKWDALLNKSGAIRKDQSTAGGRFGVGKNAVFNVSTAQTAFYYTCFQEGRGRRRHRIEKWMGKSVLTAHVIQGIPLQHIGFYRQQGGSPVEGIRIPNEFRMQVMPGQANIPSNGTTITILGFAPQSTHWLDEIAMSAAANFFLAIHLDRLAVTVIDNIGNRLRVAKHTLRAIFEKYDKNPQMDEPFSRAHCYYRAVCSQVETQCVSLPDPINGTVVVRFSTAEGPSRSAYINWNGMFITDSREVNKNPFHIRTPRYYPDYSIVVIPGNEGANEFIRNLENVAHDEVQANSIEDPYRQRLVKTSFRQTRQEILDLIGGELDSNSNSTSRNLHQLSGVIGDDSVVGTGQGQAGSKLMTRTRRQNFQTASTLNMDISDMGDLETDGRTGHQGDSLKEALNRRTENATSGAQGAKGSRPPKAPALRQVRLIAAAPFETVILLTTVKLHQTIRLRLAPVGEMETNEAGLSIMNCTEESGAAVVVKGDTIELQADSARRYCLRLKTETDTSLNALSVRSLA